jgi:hypothetical protein
MYEQLVEKGMHKKVAKPFIKKFKIEEDIYKGDENLREWAMTKGFFPSRVELYGLNDSNYKNYLPDYVDFRLHPYNNHFVIWINDKLSLKYTLGQDFNNIMPEYYLYVENDGQYTYLQDTPPTIAKDKDFIFNLLKEKKTLMIKPNSSKSGGEGVLKVELIKSEPDAILNNNLEVRINNKETLSFGELENRIKGLKNTIVTEYIHQHPKLKRIWPDSECTLRIIMVKLPKVDIYGESKWKCIVSYARFGSSVSGGASNVSSGGIGVGFDFDNGMYNPYGIRYRQFCPDGNWKYYEHPDTHVVWQNESLPNWDYVKETIYKVCNHFSSLSHLGFDVIITEQGFVFCEINSKPALNYEQVICGPVLESEENKSYFRSKGMDDVDSSELYTIYKSCQE